MDGMLSLLIDAGLVAAALAAVWLGYRRGFAKTAVTAVGYLAAVIAASLLSRWLGGMAAQCFRGPLTAYTAEKIGDGTGSLADAVQALYDGTPGFLRGWMEQFGSAEQLAQRISGTAGLAAQEAAGAIADAVLLPLASAAAGAVFFLLLFWLFCFLVRRLAAASGIVDHLPVVGGLNRLAGGVIGVVQALVVVFLLVLALSVLLSCVEGGAALAKETVLFRWCNGWMPFFRFS